MIRTENKSKWAVCRELVKESQEEANKQKKVQKEINEILLPLLTILEEDDVPVEKVWWDSMVRSIDLAPEVCLSPSTLQKIIEELPVGKPSHEFRSNSSVVYFYTSIHDFSIYNGKDICSLKKITRIVPAVERRETTWEPDGSCSQLDALMEVIEGGRKEEHVS